MSLVYFYEIQLTSYNIRGYDACTIVIHVINPRTTNVTMYPGAQTKGKGHYNGNSRLVRGQLQGRQSHAHHSTKYYCIFNIGLVKFIALALISIIQLPHFILNANISSLSTYQLELFLTFLLQSSLFLLQYTTRKLKLIFASKMKGGSI